MHQEIELIGYLGQDPEMRFTPSGQAVTNFSLATSRKWKDESGQQVSETTWWRIAVWGKQGEACKQYLSKGRPVLVKGRMGGEVVTDQKGERQVQPRIWSGNDGKPRASFEVTATLVRFLPSGNGNGAPQTDSSQPSDDWDDEQIPF